MEIDPYDPHFTPVKRTALGRFRHEEVTCVVSASGRIAVYSSADLLGATAMDRPEDFETNPVNGKGYCVMTNNTQRSTEQVDAANPRGPNRHGHIICASGGIGRP